MAQPQRLHEGIFITFEGVDGAGKTTQLRALGAWMRQRGAKVVETREPGGTPIAERIRDLVLDAENAGLSSRAELFLLLAARAEHVEQHVQPALESGQVVLCDRFTDATLAYQGAGRSFPTSFLSKANAFAANSLAPDLTILLDVDPAIGRRRLAGRGTPVDRFEGEAAAFYDRVREGYLRIAKKDSGCVVLVDASGSMAVVQEKIRNEVTRRRFVGS